ncbi:MAG: head-tail adaptor protein [Patescibacteria group bacterium]|nr:head-tail adaptor protein [Patescibacteria group bacterium]
MPRPQPWTQKDPLVIDAGELRHAIVIESPAANDGSTFGQSVVPTSWNTLRTCMAAIYTAGGRETSMAAQVVSEVSHTIKVRWTPDVVKAGYRVVFGSRYFTVQYVENVLERNRVLLLYCLEVNGGGQ